MKQSKQPKATTAEQLMAEGATEQQGASVSAFLAELEGTPYHSFCIDQATVHSVVVVPFFRDEYIYEGITFTFRVFGKDILVEQRSNQAATTSYKIPPTGGDDWYLTRLEDIAVKNLKRNRSKVK